MRGCATQLARALGLLGSVCRTFREQQQHRVHSISAQVFAKKGLPNIWQDVVVQTDHTLK